MFQDRVEAAVAWIYYFHTDENSMWECSWDFVVEYTFQVGDT